MSERMMVKPEPARAVQVERSRNTSSEAGHCPNDAEHSRLETASGFDHSFADIACTPSLRVTQRHESSEREADQVADVLTARHATNETSARAESGGNAGQFLPSTTRHDFEARLGHDLSDVRVHTDTRAADHAEALRARAFTHGRDIYFGAGQYQPHTPSGQWLLAHELAHTRQAAPGIISRFVADAPVPEPPSLTDEAEEGTDSEPTDAEAAEIENTLRTDPTDTSGQAARRLAKLPPEKRGPVIAAARAERPEMREDGIGRAVAATRTREPAADRASRTERPRETQPGARREPSPQRREERTRQAARASVSAPPPRSPTGGSRTSIVSPSITPRVPASLTRSAATPPVPSQLPTTPPDARPETATPGEERRPTSERSVAAIRGGATGQPPNGAPAGETSAGQDEDRPLRLADLFEEAPSEESPPAASPAEVWDVSETPPLEGEPLDSAAGATEMESFAAELETALANSREMLQTQAESVRTNVRQRAASARASIRADVERTVAAIQTNSSALLNELSNSLSAAHATVDYCLSARNAEATTKGNTSQDNIRGIFSDHRSTVEGTVTDAITEAERLRTQKIESARTRNQADIRTVYVRAGAKMRSYPGTRRGNYMANAAFSVAEGTAQEMRNQEPDIADAVSEVTAPLPEHFRSEGAQALNGFDVNLPEILASVGTGVEQTQADLAQQAAEAHVRLDEFATQTQAEIGGLTEEAIAQARAFTPQAEAQLDRALAELLRSIAAAPGEVINRAAPPIQEAIELFRTAENPDVEAAAQLTETLVGFLEESVTSTSATLEQAGEAGEQRFAQMRGGARQTMRAHQERCDTVWQGSRAGIQTTLSQTAEGIDAGFGASITAFQTVLDETEGSIRDQLSPVVSDLEGSFRISLNDAEADIDSRINEGLAQNAEAINELDGKMEEAANEAAWEYDHPVLAALEFIAGILVGIITVLALVVVLIVVTIVLAKVLGVSMLVAGLVLLAGMVAFSIGYAFGARLAAGQGFGEALGGAFLDFGRAAPGMLYEMTGIPKLRRAFSSEHMTPYQRGKLIGEGGTELVLAIFMVRGAARSMAGRFRGLGRVRNPDPVRASAATATPRAAPTAATTTPPRAAPTVTPRAAPGAEPGIGFGRTPRPRAPGAEPTPEPTIGFGRTPRPRAPGAQPVSEPRIGFGREPVRPAQPQPEPTIGFGREPRPRAPGAEPAPEPTIGFGRQPRPRPAGAEPVPEPRIGFGREPGPRPARTTAEPGPRSSSAEAPEPLMTEAPPPTRVGSPTATGQPLRPGGRSPLEVRASAQSGGGRGPRPSGPARPAGSSRSPRSTGESSSSRPGGPHETAPERPAAPETLEPTTPGARTGTAEPAPSAGKPAPRPSTPAGTSRPRPARSRASQTGGRKRRTRRGSRTGERRPTKAERATQARRDAESAAIQREAQGLDRPPSREPTADELLSGRAGSERNPGTIESGDVGGAQVRRGRGGREVLPEDQAVAQAAGSEFERPLVREFAARQPPTSETFGSGLGNWAGLRRRFPRIAELFSGGSRPDAVSVDPTTRTIRLFDPAARPNAAHMEGTAEYMQRLLDDPIMRRVFDGWKVIAEEGYWEAGFRNRRPRRIGRIGGSGSGSPTPP